MSEKCEGFSQLFTYGPLVPQLNTLVILTSNVFNVENEYYVYFKPTMVFF